MTTGGATGSRTDWDAVPAGLLRLTPEGRVLAANRTLLAWLERPVVGLPVADLLTGGGRVYWETHLSPLLHVERRVDEVALELRAVTGSLPVLFSAQRRDDVVEAVVFPARERVRFERELRTARRVARAAAAQVTALQSVTAALSRAVGPEAVAQALLDAALGPLRALGGVLWLADDDGALHEQGRSGRTTPEAAPAAVGDAVVIDGDRVLVPLPGQRGPRGVLAVHRSTGPGAEPLDLEVLLAVGRQGGLALDRARTYERTAEVARELQQSLLAAPVPQDSRFAVATVYRPGVEALEVGGDWYDVFLARPGVLAVVVGDVVGRGLPAASAMGQLRSAVRAVAAPGVSPAQLLSRLDRFAEQVAGATMATLAYAELDLVTGRLRWSCAGHPPPLLLPGGGPGRLLWSGRSTPLGALVAPRERPEDEVVMAPGDRLLLCTDGLFERRGRDAEEGLALVAAAAGGLADRPVGAAVDRLTRSLLHDEQGRDDVCVLLLEWAGDAFTRTLGGDLTGLSSARRALGAWLAERGVGDATRADLVLAASEALANAGEHGSRGDPDAEVRLTARVVAGRTADEVVLSVHDAGTWLSRAALSTSPVGGAPSLRTAERGRGLQIVRALVDAVQVLPEDGTTVVLRRRLVP